MGSKTNINCKKRRKQEQILIQQAWIDQDRKIISLHPIESGQLLEGVEPVFWENIISLSLTGYRLQ